MLSPQSRITRPLVFSVCSQIAIYKLKSVASTTVTSQYIATAIYKLYISSAGKGFSALRWRNKIFRKILQTKIFSARIHLLKKIFSRRTKNCSILFHINEISVTGLFKGLSCDDTPSGKVNMILIQLQLIASAVVIYSYLPLFCHEVYLYIYMLTKMLLYMLFYNIQDVYLMIV